jgi:hypothetical protein
VAINCPGLFVKTPVNCEPKLPCFLSSSILNLFEATKAISIPEKKAEKIITMIITRMAFIVQK